MQETNHLSIKVIISAVFALIALVILIDYSYSSETLTETVVSKTRRLENKHSFTGNEYYARYLITATKEISVSKAFQNTVEEGDSVTIEKSLWFKEVNRVTIPSSGLTEVYSFRSMLGAIIPSVALLILAIGYRLKSKVSTLVFVAQVVLLADLIFLLL